MPETLEIVNEETPALDPDRWQVTEEKVEAVVRRVVELAKPARIIAFGSRARGTHRPESDLDLAVILRNFDRTLGDAPVGRLDLDARMALDLLVVDEKRHEFMKDSIISVHYDIANEGITLYDERIGSVDPGAVARIAGR